MADNVELGPPRVYIGCVDGELLPETKAVGERMGATFVDHTGDDTAYFAMMENLWARGKRFILCEQDIVPTPELLREMWTCSAEWCSGWFYLYDVEPLPSGQARPQQPRRFRVAGTTALHKFSTALLRRAPHAMEEAADRASMRSWTQIDFALTHRDNGTLPCLHAAQPHLHGPVSQPTRIKPAWVPLIRDDEWIETGDYPQIDVPEPD